MDYEGAFAGPILERRTARADEIFTAAPYNTTSRRTPPNARDDVVRQSGGEPRVTLTKRGTVFACAFHIGLDVA